jgi:hypothetical protein
MARLCGISTVRARLSLTGDDCYVLFLFMSQPEDPAARRARQLRELAELGLERARTLKEQMLAAEDTSEILALAAEFEQVARGVRQSVAMGAELERRRRRAERLAQERVRPPRALIPDPESRTVH